MMENNNILIDGTSHCQYTGYLSLVIGSLVANKHKEFVNSIVVIILPMAQSYAKRVQIKVAVMILKTKRFHPTVSTFCNPI